MATVLLVNDDPFQAFVRMATLKSKFAEVERVANPSDVLCLIEQPDLAGRLSLVIVDLRRSDCDAADLVAELHRRLPQLPVLVLRVDNSRPEQFAAEGVRYLPQRAASEQMLLAASQMFAHAALA